MKKRDRNQEKTMSDNPKAPAVASVQLPAPAVADWTYGDKLLGVSPVILLNKTPVGSAWVVNIDDARVAAGSSDYTINPTSIAPKVLDAFIDLHGLDALINPALGEATAVFGPSNYVSKKRLVTDSELHEDFVRLEIRVKGLSREQFRTARKDFDAKVAALPAAFGLERVLIIVSRSAD